MHGAERVVHVRVGELGQPARERRVVRFFGRIEPEVLQQDHLVGGELARRRLRQARDRSFEELGETRARRCQAQIVAHLTLRAAEVRREHQRGAALEQLAERGQRGADARVVGDDAVRQRDVEVHADEDPPPGDVPEVVEGSQRHRAAATRSTRSTSRFE